MNDPQAQNEQLRERVALLEAQLEEAEATLRAIRSGEVDAVVVDREEEAEIFALASAERFYFQLAQEAASIGTWDWNPLTKKLFWSDGIYSLLGYEPQAFPPSLELFLNAIPAKDRPRVEAMLAGVTASEKELYLEFRIVRADGATRWLASKGSVLRDQAGAVSRIIGINLDITDRKQIEEALQESEQRFRRLANVMPHAAWIAKANGDVEYFNDRWYDISGLPRDSGFLSKWTDILHPEDVERTVAAWQEAVRTGTCYNIEYRFLDRRTQTHRWFLGRALPVRDEEGNIQAWFGTATDIHDMKVAHEALQRSEELLRETDRRKDEFLAMLGHELRNPLAAISNGLQLVGMTQLDDASKTWSIDMMQRQVKSLTHIVDDLLDVSRITQGKIQLKMESLQVSHLLRRTAASVKSLVEEHGHELVLAIGGDSLWIQGDATRIEQVITNLLTNACKYTKQQGTIWLSAQREGGDVLIAVKDTGIGIHPEVLTKIFDLFVQADRALDRAEGGLGIGLTVVKRLVEMHGGSISAASAGDGRGAEFIVRLPALDPPVETAAASNRFSAQAASPRDVLVVDDNHDSALALEMLLKAAGYTVHLARDGRQALETAKVLRPGVVLLDIGLPGMDGYEVARQLRRHQDFGKALLVAVSGYGQIEDRQRSVEAGFDKHLVKPVDFAALLSLLQSTA
jgi:PAS domain S-box-containing protein